MGTRLTCFWVGQNKKSSIISMPNIYYTVKTEKKMIKGQWPFLKASKIFFNTSLLDTRQWLILTLRDFKG